MAKPIVDGIERDLKGRAQVIRLSVISEVGSQVARRYGVRGVPTLILFDAEGNLVDQIIGVPSRDGIVDRVNALPIS
ncbi:MAG: thioredoxin family protein [Anaerolineae bacterium]|nr:thioredoxin family protein [Anaerolineae bacterium]